MITNGTDKQNRSAWFLILLLILIIPSSCRDGFNEDFPNLEIINNAPIIGEIDTVAVLLGGEAEINFANFTSDKEQETLMFMASSTDESIATISEAEGSIFNIEGINLGFVTMNVTATDGNEGNEVSSTFVVSVVESLAPPAIFQLNFNSEANGTDVTDVTMPDGGSITFLDDGGGGATATVQSGVLDFDLNGSAPEVIGAATFTFASPIDISSSPFFEFDYANVFSGAAFYILIFDNAGNEFLLGDGYENVDLYPEDWVVGDGNFNTFSVDLSTTGLDLTQITSIYFEAVSTGSGSFQIDNLILGPAADPFADASFVLTLDGVANGTDVTTVILPDGGTIDFLDDGGAGATATVESESINLNLDGSGPEVIGAITLTFAAPLDASETPLFEFEYANMFEGAALYILVFDGSGGDVLLGDGYVPVENFPDEWVVGDSNFNTFSFDLSGTIDLSQVTSIYIEGVSTGAGEFQLDNIRLTN